MRCVTWDARAGRSCRFHSATPRLWTSRYDHLGVEQVELVVLVVLVELAAINQQGVALVASNGKAPLDSSAYHRRFDDVTGEHSATLTNGVSTQQPFW